MKDYCSVDFSTLTQSMCVNRQLFETYCMAYSRMLRTYVGTMPWHTARNMKQRRVLHIQIATIPHTNAIKANGNYVNLNANATLVYAVVLTFF